MTDRKPLMPKATAVWLVSNTALTFDQIAEFCGLHVLEVKGIADGDVAQGIKGLDPVSSGQLTRDEIKRGEEDAGHKLRLFESNVNLPQSSAKKRPRYTPVSRRHDRPNAVLWLLRNHPELKDSQIMRLVGTTKPTIAQIRDRSHWNSPNLVPQDPVTLGLCSQVDLDAEVRKASRRSDRDRPEGEVARAGTLLSAEETTAGMRPVAEIMQTREAPGPRAETESEEAARVLAKLRTMKSSEQPVEGDDDVGDEEAGGEDLLDEAEPLEDADDVAAPESDDDR